MRRDETRRNEVEARQTVDKKSEEKAHKKQTNLLLECTDSSTNQLFPHLSFHILAFIASPSRRVARYLVHPSLPILRLAPIVERTIVRSLGVPLRTLLVLQSLVLMLAHALTRLRTARARGVRAKPIRAVEPSLLVLVLLVRLLLDADATALLCLA
jgi:hypothetical protein